MAETYDISDVSLWQNWLKLSSVMVNIKNTEGQFIAASDAYAKYLGYESADDIVGKYLTDIFPFKHAATCIKQEKIVLNTLKKYTFHHEFMHPKRGSLCVEGIKTPIYNKKKEIIAVETVINDVTEKYSLIHKLQREQRKFKRFFNDIPVAVWIKDARNRFINVNKEFCEMLNIKKEDILGQKFINHENIHGMMGEEELAILQAQDEFVLKENKRHVFEFCTFKDGKKGCYKMIKIPIFRKGKIVGLVGCCHSTSDKPPM